HPRAAHRPDRDRQEQAEHDEHDDQFDEREPGLSLTRPRATAHGHPPDGGYNRLPTAVARARHMPTPAGHGVGLLTLCTVSISQTSGNVQQLVMVQYIDGIASIVVTSGTAAMSKFRTPRRGWCAASHNAGDRGQSGQK